MGQKIMGAIYIRILRKFLESRKCLYFKKFLSSVFSVRIYLTVSQIYLYIPLLNGIDKKNSILYSYDDYFFFFCYFGSHKILYSKNSKILYFH